MWFLFLILWICAFLSETKDNSPASTVQWSLFYNLFYSVQFYAIYQVLMNKILLLPDIIYTSKKQSKMDIQLGSCAVWLCFNCTTRPIWSSILAFLCLLTAEKNILVPQACWTLFFLTSPSFTVTLHFFFLLWTGTVQFARVSVWAAHRLR